MIVAPLNPNEQGARVRINGQTYYLELPFRQELHPEILKARTMEVL